jgi:hypothetical protein
VEDSLACSDRELGPEEEEAPGREETMQTRPRRLCASRLGTAEPTQRPGPPVRACVIFNPPTLALHAPLPANASVCSSSHFYKPIQQPQQAANLSPIPDFQGSPQVQGPVLVTRSDTPDITGPLCPTPLGTQFLLITPTAKDQAMPSLLHFGLPPSYGSQGSLCMVGILSLHS